MTKDDFNMVAKLRENPDPWLTFVANRIVELSTDLNESLANAQRLKGVVTERNNSIRKSVTREDIITKARSVLKANAAKKLTFSELYALDVAIRVHDKRKV
jgi:hypothetical protein